MGNKEPCYIDKDNNDDKTIESAFLYYFLSETTNF